MLAGFSACLLTVVSFAVLSGKYDALAQAREGVKSRSPSTRIGIGIGLIYRWPPRRISLREGGAMVALAGATFLWSAISPRGTL
jgi:hypothetical protein